MANRQPVPIQAIGMIRAGASAIDLVNAKIPNWYGTPVQKRTARRWIQAFNENDYDAYDPEDADAEEDLINSNPYEDEVVFTVQGSDKAQVVSESTRIRTPEELLEIAQVDLDMWEVKAQTVQTQEVHRSNVQRNLKWNEKGQIYDSSLQDQGEFTIDTLYHVKVTLARRESKPLEDAVAEILSQLPTSGLYKRPAGGLKHMGGDHLVMPSLYDFHFVRRDYYDRLSIDDQEEIFMAVIDAMVERIKELPYPVGQILFPIGNDAMQIDTIQKTTSKGTPQDVNTSIYRMTKALVKCYPYAIERFLEIAPVHCVVVNSNHDKLNMWWLGMYLEQVYKDEPLVTIDSGSEPVKFFRYGKTGMGFMHGENGGAKKFPWIMATEAPFHLNEVDHVRGYHGHYHTAQGAYVMMSDERGMIIRSLPALAESTEWEIVNFYYGNIRMGELEYIHIEHGPGALLPIFPPEVI